MAIATSCPKCKASFRLDDSLAGKKARCQRCAEIFVVPALSGAAAVPAAIPVVMPPAPPPASAFQSAAPSPPRRTTPEPRAPKIDAEPPFAELAKPPEPKESAPAKGKVSPLLQGIGIAAGLGGAALGRFVGLPLLIVLFFAALVGVPLHYLTSGKRRQMVPAGAVQAGHALWMLLGVVLLAAGVVPGFGLDPMILLEGLLFLAAAILVVLWPHWIALIVLSLYQVAAFFLNLYQLTWGNPPPDFVKALILHLCLRVLAVVLMWVAFFHKADQPARP